MTGHTLAGQSNTINFQYFSSCIILELDRDNPITESKYNKEVCNQYLTIKGNKLIPTHSGEEEACMAVLNNFYGDGKLK